MYHSTNPQVDYASRTASLPSDLSSLKAGQKALSVQNPPNFGLVQALCDKIKAQNYDRVDAQTVKPPTEEAPFVA